MIFSEAKAIAWFAGKGAKLLVLLVALALVGSTYALTYYAGRHAVELEVATEKAALADQKAKLVAKDAQLRIAVAEDATGRREVILNNNATGLRKLNEAIKAGGVKPSCDLTDDELRAFQQIGQE